MRRVTYRTAVNAFVFTGLWLVIGAIVLWSPVPGALGIAGGFFTAWVLLFFGALAFAGGALTVAALNAAFPQSTAAPPPRRPAAPRRSGAPMWAPPQQQQTTPAGRPPRGER